MSSRFSRVSTGCPWAPTWHLTFRGCTIFCEVRRYDRSDRSRLAGLGAQIQALGQTGLTYSLSGYDTERYTRPVAIGPKSWRTRPVCRPGRRWRTSWSSPAVPSRRWTSAGGRAGRTHPCWCRAADGGWRRAGQTPDLPGIDWRPCSGRASLLCRPSLFYEVAYYVPSFADLEKLNGLLEALPKR